MPHKEAPEMCIWVKVSRLIGTSGGIFCSPHALARWLIRHGPRTVAVLKLQDVKAIIHSVTIQDIGDGDEELGS